MTRRYAPRVVTPSTDDAIVAGLRSGDEAVFAQLLDDWSRSMLLLARTFVSTEASAEEVVQDTWLAVIQGHRPVRGPILAADLGLPDPGQHREEARRAGEPHRAVEQPVADDDHGPTVDPALFRDAGDAVPGRLAVVPAAWPIHRGDRARR